MRPLRRKQPCSASQHGMAAEHASYLGAHIGGIAVGVRRRRPQEGEDFPSSVSLSAFIISDTVRYTCNMYMHMYYMHMYMHMYMDIATCT